jgi:uncharacterized protein (DUF3084 family)
MHYKTLLLELIRQNPELHSRLKQSSTLAATLDQYAQELKQIHEALQADLSQLRPQHDPIQLRGEALELALKEMESRFAFESAADEANPLSLDDAMAFLRRATPTA